MNVDTVSAFVNMLFYDRRWLKASLIDVIKYDYMFSRLLSCEVFCGGVLVNVFKSSLDAFESSVFFGLYGMWVFWLRGAFFC